MVKRIKGLSPSMKIYFIILALSALGLGMSNGVISNYFKEVYDVTAAQRGFIELPREMPGVLAIFVIAFLAGFSDIKIAMIAQTMTIFGILILGLFTPPFEIMLVFLFINSMGMHMGMPLRDSIGMNLVEDKNIGKWMGQFKGVYTGFTMLAALFVFITFRFNIFSFKTDIKWIFIVSGSILVLVVMLYGILMKTVDHKIVSNKRVNFIIRKEYRYYYILTIMLGVQKQIMLVYGPWVLIETLSKGPDTIAVLSIIGSFIGIFFIPAIGRWTDRFGVKKLLYADALSFIGVYVLYGFLAAGFNTGKLALVGVPVFLAYLMFIIDRMSTQMGLIRTIYLKKILVKPSDFTPTLSLGLSFDHIVSITSALIGGLIWDKWGPQYIFFLAASLSFVNLFVAKKVQIRD